MSFMSPTLAGRFFTTSATWEAHMPLYTCPNPQNAAGDTRGKEPACQYRRCRRCGFDLYVGKIPLEEGMATHSSFLAWRISWTEDLAGYSSWVCKEFVTWSDWACTECTKPFLNSQFKKKINSDQLMLDNRLNYLAMLSKEDDNFLIFLFLWMIYYFWYFFSFFKTEVQFT